MKLLEFVTETKIGIKEWLVPQISEHCPVNKPIRFENTNNWLSRPGRASALIPNDGIAHEWITSADVTSERIRFITGK